MPASKSPVSIAALAAMSSTVAREAEAGNAFKNASASSFLACGSRSPTKASSDRLSLGSWNSSKTVCCGAWPRNSTVSTSCGRAFPHSRAISAAKARIDRTRLTDQRVLGLMDTLDLCMPRLRCRRPPECVPLAYLQRVGTAPHWSLAIGVGSGQALLRCPRGWFRFPTPRPWLGRLSRASGTSCPSKPRAWNRG